MTRILKSPLTILLLCAIAAYWPVALCLYTFKWDMLDVVLPFRYFGGECIRNGIFPLWNPYTLTGVPVFADMQYPLWSPEMWLTGLTLGYSIYMLHFLFVFYLVLAGYGMYRLTFHFNASRRYALLAGITYMLSGFFVGHGQALFSMIGAAFLPWVVLYMIRNCQGPTMARTLKLALFIFLMITTGYQFISVMTGYLLLAIFVYYLAGYRKSREQLIRLIRFNAVLLITVILLSLVLVVPVIQASGYNERIGAGLPYNKTLVASFTWQSLISLVTPFATVKYPEFFRTDISMRNMHMGLIMLLVFTAGLVRKKPGILWLILIYGAVCLLASFGNALPLHRLMFRFLPFIKMLRMPAYFNLFTSFAVILVAGIQLPTLVREEKFRRSLKAILIPAVILITVLMIYSGFHASDAFPDLRKAIHQTREFLASLNFHDHILVQGSLQLILLLCLFFFLQFAGSGRRFANALFVLVCMEMILAVNLNGYFTVYDPIRPERIHSFMQSQPRGFPIPQNLPVNQNSDRNLVHDPLWRNMGILTKRISYDGFSSFILKPYNYLDDSLPVLRDELMGNAPVYLSGRVHPDSEIPGKDGLYHRMDIYIPDGDYRSLPAGLKRSEKIPPPEITSFTPVHCTVRYALDSSAVLTYLQADFPGWEARLDGKKIPLIRSNFMYLSALAPPGEHRIEFRYRNPYVIAAFILSYAVFIALLLGIILPVFSRSGSHGPVPQPSGGGSV